jgi:superfamily II DNA or RNA helicase/HKD family nuclease
VFASGIYESLITTLLNRRLQDHAAAYYYEKEKLDPAEAAVRLSRFIAGILETVLASIEEADETVQKQIELANGLLIWLQSYVQNEEISSNLLEAEGKLLKAILARENPVAADLGAYLARVTPLTGLTQSELFTGCNAGISLESEMTKEILSADEICWIVSFIKWSGLRIFMPALEEWSRRGIRLRVITTTYLGATDAKAVEALAALPHAEVKVNYETNHERLHAKSYLFLRKSGFHTAYVGSSNLSRPALTSGLEWNMKVTTSEIPHVIKKFQSTFETYWASDAFERFRPENADDRMRLRMEIDRARGTTHAGHERVFYDLQPHKYQQVILEQLEAERKLHDRWRNLVVAATGTGKTMVAAFDFRRFLVDYPNARFLYVAHREEILRQSHRTFQDVLRLPSFGELWVGDHRASSYTHLFVSIQTLNNQLDDLRLTPDYYDYIVVDEVHHIAASSYRRILERFQPKILLGLTATPERLDGVDILEDFCGTLGAELRLPDAIDQQFLCPFQYFGLDDDVDLSHVGWERGRYLPAELTHIYTSNDRHVDNIVRNIDRYITDMTKVRALGFCATQEHARYMAEKFTLRGIPAAVLTSNNADERMFLRDALVQRRINVLFVVDIFNEGVDIPEIDTVLFLRPTESLTIFLQQLGRGLRRVEGKTELTVLDFVGNARPEYDFTQKFRALMGKTARSVEQEIKDDFPHLPLGCSIVLQQQAKEIILRNVRHAVANRNVILRLIRGFREHTNLPLTLANFLMINPAVSIDDLYKSSQANARGWHQLCALAGNPAGEVETALEALVVRAIRNRFLMTTSLSYLRFIRQLINNHFTWDQTDPLASQFAVMLYWDIWDKPGPALGYASLDDTFMTLAADTRATAELAEVIDLLLNRLDVIELPMSIGEPIVLHLHARYTRDEILSAFGTNTIEQRFVSQTGVHVIPGRNIELLFVTLEKTEKHFSPTTMFRDYAINDILFHWQTQNSAAPDRGKRIILFVREQKTDQFGRTMGFVNLGPVHYVSHTGARPMNIVWRLERPMPAWFWRDAAKLAVGA